MGIEGMLAESLLWALVLGVLSLISVVSGIYFMISGIWELRVATDRDRYIAHLFNGILLVFIIPPVLVLFINTMI